MTTFQVLTSRKYGVATVWLVATLGSKSGLRKINRKAILDVNIPKACEMVLEPGAPMALRLQSNLMYGILKVYSQQCNFTLSDAQAAQLNMRTLLKARSSAGLDPNAGKVKPNQLVVQDDPAFVPQSFSPMFDIDLSELGSFQSCSLQAMANVPLLLDSSKTSQRSSANVSFGLQIPTSGSGHRDSYFSPRSTSGHVAQNVTQGLLLPSQEGDGSGFDPNVAFEFDEEGNILERAPSRGLSPDQDGDHQGSNRRMRSSSASGFRLEHGGEFVALSNGMTQSTLDAIIPHTRLKVSDYGQPNPIVCPFPYGARTQSPLVLSNVHDSVSSNPAAIQDQQRRFRRTIQKDDRPQIRNSTLANWNAEYVMNMAIAREQRSLRKRVMQAKHRAYQVVFGVGINRIGMVKSNSRTAHPLAMFAGDSIRGMLVSPVRKRAASVEDVVKSTSPHKQRKMSPSPIAGRGLSNQGAHPEVALSAEFEEDIERGRQPQPSLQDHSSHMPWNIASSQYGSRQGSRQSSLVRTHMGRSSANRGIQGSGRASHSSAFDIHADLGSSPSSHAAVSSPLRSRALRYDKSSFGTQLLERTSPVHVTEGEEQSYQPDFELLGPALDVDTQTAAGSQWIRTALSAESSNFLGFVKTNSRKLGMNEGAFPGSTKEIPFHDLLPETEHTRTVAAQGFMHVLTLASRSLLQVKQELPYDEIIMMAVD